MSQSAQLKFDTLREKVRHVILVSLLPKIIGTVDAHIVPQIEKHLEKESKCQPEITLENI